MIEEELHNYLLQNNKEYECLITEQKRLAEQRKIMNMEIKNAESRISQLNEEIKFTEKMGIDRSRPYSADDFINTKNKLKDLISNRYRALDFIQHTRRRILEIKQKAEELNKKSQKIFFDSKNE